MNRLQYLFALVSLLALLSCDQSLPRTDISATPSTLPQIAANGPDIPGLVGNNPVAAAKTSKLNPAHGSPGHRCDIAVGAPLNSGPAFQTSLPASAVSGQPLLNLPRNPALPVSSTPVMQAVSSNPVSYNTSPGTAAGLNPAHGLPGHRCDIAVGAPLNSPPGKTATVAAPQKTSPATAKGMNPKHGEPLHRCDIPVGAPLNSPVRQNNATPAVAAPATAAITTATPVQPGVIPADGLNPKHGEPGHRCDIAVGAPLNAKK